MMCSCCSRAICCDVIATVVAGSRDVHVPATAVASSCDLPVLYIATDVASGCDVHVL